MATLAGQLMLPTLISAAGLILTQTWYTKASKVAPIKGVGDPIAILQYRSDQVERRPTTRVIWQDVNQGDALYSGEAVRTTSAASGRIQFIKSGVTVGLEPDSVVVIEETDGKLALNLINGGVFVKNDTPTDGGRAGKSDVSQPVIKAGNQTLAMNDKKTEMNLSVSDTGQANVVVSKGDITVASKSGKSETVKEGTATALATDAAAPLPIELINAQPNATITLTQASSAMTAKWKPLAQTMLIQLEIASSRDQLKPKGTAVSGNLGTIKFDAKAGGFFWRLVSRNSTGKVIAQSPTIFNQGLVLEAPRLITNAANEHIFSNSTNVEAKASLTWSRPAGAESITVTIAKDQALKEVIDTKSFATETEWVFVPKAPGAYYWKATSAWHGIDRTISSPTGVFHLDRQAELPIPQLESPADHAIFTKAQTDTSGVLLSWSAPTGIEQFDILLEQQQPNKTWGNATKTHISQAQHRFNQLAAGIWRWSIVAKNDNSASKPSDWRTFQIVPVERLDTSAINAAPILLPTDNILKLKVGGIPANTTRVRFRTASSAANLEAATWQQGLLTGQLAFKVNGVGSYQILIEALDKSDRQIAVSDSVTFEVKLPDKLPAPALTNKATKLDATAGGSVTLDWTKVQGATRYIIAITGSKGPLFRKEYLPTQKPTLNGLPPGVHKLTLTAIDGAGRPGETSPEITLNVPDVSDVAAPTAKGLKVR